jgi:hypothetical protein
MHTHLLQCESFILQVLIIFHNATKNMQIRLSLNWKSDTLNCGFPRTIRIFVNWNNFFFMKKIKETKNCHSAQKYLFIKDFDYCISEQPVSTSTIWWISERDTLSSFLLTFRSHLHVIGNFFSLSTFYIWDFSSDSKINLECKRVYVCDLSHHCVNYLINFFLLNSSLQNCCGIKYSIINI